MIISYPTYIRVIWLFKKRDTENWKQQEGACDDIHYILKHKITNVLETSERNKPKIYVKVWTTKISSSTSTR
jgi:hypothetical protein